MEQIKYDAEEECVKGLIAIEKAEKAELAWNMLEHNRIEGILPFEYYYLNDMVCFCYQVASYHSLEMVYGEREMNFQELCLIWKELLSIWERGREYLLDEQAFLFAPDYIFLHIHEKKAALCYLPGGSEACAGGRKKLGEFLLKKVCYSDKKAVEFVYEMYDLLSSKFFQMEQVKALSDRFFENRVELEGEEECHSQKQEGIKRTWTIGRSKENEICIPDRTISKRHVQISFERGQYFVMDLSSLNGTMLNGKPIASYQKKSCEDEDLLAFARYVFRLGFMKHGNGIKLVECNGKLPEFCL